MQRQMNECVTKTCKYSGLIRYLLFLMCQYTVSIFHIVGKFYNFGHQLEFTLHGFT